MSSGPNSSDIKKERLHQIENVPWSLSKATIGGKAINTGQIINYRFLFGDSSIYGYDGCNWFGGEYRYSNGTITYPTGIWSTEIACISNTDFISSNIPKVSNLQIYDTTITLFSSDTSITLTSKYLESITNYSFIYKKWKLSSSNENIIDSLVRYDLLPELEFTINRKYKLRWDHVYQNNELRYNYILGSIGIASDSTISMYISGSSQTVSSYPINVYVVANRILHSNKIIIESQNITLWNISENKYYRFKVIN
jgi:hypothetical protein